MIYNQRLSHWGSIIAGNFLIAFGANFLIAFGAFAMYQNTLPFFQGKNKLFASILFFVGLLILLAGNKELKEAYRKTY